MRELNRGEILKEILATADRHPNARVSRLMKCVETEKNQKNIVLLLIELAEQPELSLDMTISLKYYLDMFEELSEEPSLSEAGLLLSNSAVIYGRRVDNVHMIVERLILSLINTESVNAKCDESDGNLKSNTDVDPKYLKRGRKRPLEQFKGPYEADIRPKRFKVMPHKKRFDDGLITINKKIDCSKSQIKGLIRSISTDFTHPTIWKYSNIEDFDYGDDIDLKKNYKLFTYHLEHRYNTLIPDINFKMYFKIKDYIDAESRDSTNSEIWPPLSDAYIEHYVNLENQILHNEGHDAQNQYSTHNRQRLTITKENNSSMQKAIVTCNDLQFEDCHDSEVILNEHCNNRESSLIESNREELQSTNNIVQNVSSDFDTQISIISCLTPECTQNKISTPSRVDCEESANTTINQSVIQCEARIELQPIENFQQTESSKMESSQVNILERDPTLLDPKTIEDDLTTVKVILPHLDDEGVFFSDLDERDQQMLSPAVVATDVFRCIKDKRNIVVIIDDVIKKIYNIQEPAEHVISLPVFPSQPHPSLPLNILKIHHKYFKKRRTFKLGSEFHLMKKERHKKYARETKQPVYPRMRVRLNEDASGVPLSPPSSPNYEPDFYGFPEETLSDKNRTLSRDSGISLQHVETEIDILPESANETSAELLTTAEILSINDVSKQNQQTANAVVEADDLDELSEISADISKNENLTSKMTKVQQWHAHLQPILAQSRDRHHFDIFALGTEILNQFDRSDINNKIISLSHLMENKDNSMISRYFLSALLLANQGNISINVNDKSSELPSDVNEIELSLLSTKRNIVSIEDNIGLQTSQILIERPLQQPFFSTIRTLKPVLSIPTTDDHDSGISMSDSCST